MTLTSLRAWAVGLLVMGLLMTGGLALFAQGGVRGTIESSGGVQWRMAIGSKVLDGSNPSSVTTGLTTITVCNVTNRINVSPADDVVSLTTQTDAIAGRLDIYAWGTNGTDPTLVASTNSTTTIDWLCVGL